MAALPAAPGDLGRVRLAGRGDVEHSALRDVVDGKHLAPGDRRTGALRERAMACQRRIHELAQVGERGDRGELAGRGGRLQPLAPEQLCGRRATDVAVEARAAFYVDRATQGDQLDADAVLGYAPAAALARQQMHV